jgi:hypothetical protein
MPNRSILTIRGYFPIKEMPSLVDNISFPKPKGYGKLKRGVQPYQSSNPLS